MAKKKCMHLLIGEKIACGAEQADYWSTIKSHVTCKNCIRLIAAYKKGTVPGSRSKHPKSKPVALEENTVIHLSRLWGEPKERWFHLKYNGSEDDFLSQCVPVCGETGRSVMRENQIDLVNCKKCLISKKKSLAGLIGEKNLSILEHITKQYSENIELIDARLGKL